MEIIKFLFISLLSLATTLPAMEAPIDRPPQDLDEQLCRAFHANDVNKIEELLKAGANPNARIHNPGWGGPTQDEYYHRSHSYTISPLEWAMRLYPHLKICKLLIQYGTDLAKAHSCRPALFVVHEDTQSAKAFDMYNLLFESGANIYELSHYADEGELNPLDRAVDLFCDTHYKFLIICAHFNPQLDRRYFSAHARIMSALSVFKHLCPRMPKDIKRIILGIDEELKTDLQIISHYGKLSALDESHAHEVPLPIVHLLIERMQWDPQTVIDRIKANHIACMKPLMERARTRARGIQRDGVNMDERIKMLNPDLLEEHFGAAIEENIRRRFHLIPWYERLYDALLNNPCILQ